MPQKSPNLNRSAQQARPKLNRVVLN
ncbi:hypothetical protein RB2654_14270 [Rhodobacterales bacterium HTCC2654]|uniref:Uncharacterized protein n=1 Tax=Maritimibacter alkaliphilus HTCC2654 TaxID=314271 RepID=A3VGQ3_9RHOB|nr:hypothetical protein RB2654_14270 [Rhodobacterales bacterium HTCC2654] [Maritimibacter alkaliphilus HTCC2654]